MQQCIAVYRYSQPFPLQPSPFVKYSIKHSSPEEVTVGHRAIEDFVGYILPDFFFSFFFPLFSRPRAGLKYLLVFFRVGNPCAECEKQHFFPPDWGMLRSRRVLIFL